MNIVWLEGSAQEMKVSKLWLVASEGESSLKERIGDVRQGPSQQQRQTLCNNTGGGRRIEI